MASFQTQKNLASCFSWCLAVPSVARRSRVCRFGTPRGRPEEILLTPCPRVSLFPTLIPRTHPENHDTGGICAACGNGSHPGGRWGCPVWRGAPGEGTPEQRPLGTGLGLVRSGLFLELSWPDFPVSCVCQLLPAWSHNFAPSKDPASLLDPWAGRQPLDWGSWGELVVGTGGWRDP